MKQKYGREEWIDRLKGVLIILVVIGHVVGTVSIFCPAGFRPFTEYVYRVIYLFHMPAFFAVSGILWHQPIIGFPGFCYKKMMRLIVPFWIFGAISALIYFFLAQGLVSSAGSQSGYWEAISSGRSWWHPVFVLATGLSWPGTHGFRCNSVLWFLPCLFFVTCCYYWVDRFFIKRGARWIVLLACLVLSYVVSVPFPLPWWLKHLGMVLFYLPYLLIGHLSAGWARKMVGLPYGLILGLALLYLLAAFYMPFQADQYERLDLRVLTVVFSVAGTALAVCFARRMSFQVLEVIGFYSLGIMLLHKLVMLGSIQLFPFLKGWMRLGGCWAVVAALILTGLAIGLSVAASVVIRWYFPWALGWGRGAKRAVR